MDLSTIIIWQFFVIIVSVIATLFIVLKIAFLLMPLSKDVEIVRGISDLYTSLGFALISILGFFSISYFNNNILLVLTIAVSTVLSFYFSYVALYSLRNSLAIPLKMIRNVNSIARSQRRR